MPDFNVRSDAVNVEQIMEQIRARIREKRGVDYTEAQIRELAGVKLEKFLDPRGVRSDLLEQFRRAQPPYAPPELPNFAFEEDTLFESTRGPLRAIRKLLRPLLKLFFNPNPLIQALHIQSKLNAGVAEREAQRDAARYAFDQLHYEVMHNLVIETTRIGIEVKNMTMRLESLASRLEFNERRARALESAVVYRPAAEDAPQQGGRREEGRREDTRRHESRRQESRRPEPPSKPQAQPQTQPPVAAQPSPTAPDAGTAPNEAPAQDGTVVEGPGQKSRRRRRRRGRRGAGSAAALMAGSQPEGDTVAETEDDGDDTGADVSTTPPTPREAPDSRTARPEPFEHTFGAQAHPAETQASDPTHSANPPAAPRSEPLPAESGPAQPGVTPEQ